MTKEIDHIHLFGNPRENFYSLGKRDKIAFDQLYKQMSSLCARNNILTKVLRSTTEFSKTFIKNNESHNIKDMQAYAEGLEIPLDKVLFALCLPEMVSAFNKFSPNLLSLIPGCSSLFTWDESSKGVVHGRVLDYALGSSFQQNERSLTYELTNRNKIFSFGSAGIPHPSLSAMNDQGLTLAVHYKHGENFDLTGEPIFFMANDILSYCSDIREAIKLIKSRRSMSFWGLYLADKNGEVAAIDINGLEISHEKFAMEDHKYLYFNNRPILKKKQAQLLQPFGNKDQCIMRAEVVKKRVQAKKATKDLMLDTLSLLGSPPNSNEKESKLWQMAPITPSSLQLVSFHNQMNKAYFIKGLSPKFFQGEYIEYSKIFSSMKQEQKGKLKKEPIQAAGYFYFSQFQSSLDAGDIPQAYHSIQMAIEKLKNLPESNIAKFYFYITQYIFENDKRDQIYVFKQLKELKDQLPPYLEDQRILFEMRFEKILDLPVENKSAKINHKELKKLYEKESQLNTIALKGLRHLIFPRIDVLDVITAY